MDSSLSRERTPAEAARCAKRVEPGPAAEALSPDSRDVLLLVNRKAGAGRGANKLYQLETQLKASGFAATRVAGPDELGDRATELLRAGRLRAVVAVGGDGTVGLALNKTPQGAPLAVMPAGTENLLAKYLQQRSRPDEVIDLLANGVVIRLDAGVADGRLFALMVSVGLDADVVHRLHNNRRGNITHLAYAKPMLDSLRIYKYPWVRARWSGPGGRAGEAVGRWLFGMNLPRYAQGLPIAPRATGIDGLLDLCVFERGHLSSAIWYVWHMLRRRHHMLPSVSMIQCERFCLEAESEQEVPYQLDGDPGGFLPVTVTSIPGRLTCVVQPAVARRLGFRTPAASGALEPTT